MISNKKTYVFDIDGTLCEIKPDNKEYSEVTPIQGMIDRLNLLYTDGCYIILFTSRGMRTSSRSSTSMRSTSGRPGWARSISRD